MVPFRSGEELSLPELARTQGFDSDTFTVVDVIRGGMGVCARVRQAPSGPSFAVKALPAASRKGADFERFLVELQIWLTLSVCDGIVEALCVFRLEKTPVVCSRWMSGGNLRSQMSSRDPELFYRTIVRIAGALDWAAVEHGILHRDLKPENILIDDLHRAAVSDWGIARTLGEDELGGREADVVIYGTAAYASPEQLLGGVPLDLRSDIYSLGCVMYEWETGQTPFLGDWHEIREAKIRGEPPKVARGLFRTTSFGADDVITRCLQRERHDRYPDWKAFVRRPLDRGGPARHHGGAVRPEDALSGLGARCRRASGARRGRRRRHGPRRGRTRVRRRARRHARRRRGEKARGTGRLAGGGRPPFARRPSVCRA